jgi:hypothetical protein
MALPSRQACSVVSSDPLVIISTSSARPIFAPNMVNAEHSPNGGQAMHVIEVVFTGIVMCFVTATIIGLVSATPKPSPVKVPSKPASIARVALN